MPASSPLTPDTATRSAAQGARHAGLSGLDVAMLAFYMSLALCEGALGVLHAGWPSAIALDSAELLTLLAFCLEPSWRPVVGRLLVLGATAGILELFTDLSGERVVHSLVYPAHEPTLLASPIYMPVAWTCVLVELAYLAWRLPIVFPSLSRWAVALLCALVGAITVPYYEEMAYFARWWKYADAPHIGHTPWYVVLFEGLTAALLPWATSRLTRRGFRHAILMGGAIGVWMPIAALCSWLLIGR